ncbi:hypothetical protein DRF65_24110 [Chryseobacterium pennae]|uniref:DUF4279 domain-containing protein n=1 Tax=Chryseobacterium pennae TaxID=2258962 RepID=A0A3D9C1S8_9FLAO|nr:hypothetical protein [Chryseobacterium pennae]REC59815.1 hypothetical protein DRF65_24110 [Chryseobacterium pennae]
MTEYILKIEASKQFFPQITSVLGIEPSKTDYAWELSIKENDEVFTKAIPYFISLIEHKRSELEKIGITGGSVSVWLYKVYIGQCNMEFSPAEMKLLSDHDITLCVSCWEDVKDDQVEKNR